MLMVLCSFLNNTSLPVYRLPYQRRFGGATSFRPDVFELVNGYSNEFYGWGGEDDDMLRR